MAAGRTKAVVALVFVAALAGGAAAGLLASRYIRPATQVVVPGEASLTAELQLTKDQQSKIREIWEQFRDQNLRSYQQGDELDQWRNDQLVKLLNDEQKKQFSQIQNEYQNRFTEMKSKRELAFKDAVDKTKRLLNNQQRQRYEQILARRLGSDGAAESQPVPTHPAPTFSASSVSKEVVSPG